MKEPFYKKASPNKAISPLIAGVILIAFTIAVGILVTSALTSITKQQTEATTIKQQCPLASLEILSTSCESTNITQEQENWWDSSYSYRQQITVTNNAGSILEQDYTISTEFDLNTCVNQGKCLASGNDTRIVWYNTTSEENIELDRILEPSTALRFDGSGERVQVADSDDFYLSNLTFVSWFKTNQVDNYDYIIFQDNGDYGFQWFTFLNNHAALILGQSVGNIGSVEGTTNIADEKWHQMVGTYNGSVLAIFVDGEIENTASWSGTVPNIGNPLYFGARGTGANPYSGIADEIAIFNRTLDSTEISELYNNGVGRPISSSWFNTTGLVGLWHMDIDGNDNSTHVYDSSGNGNNGTINGAYHIDGKIVPNAEANNVIWFKLQESISAGGWDANYSIYYGNPGAGVPPTSLCPGGFVDGVCYELYDDYTEGSSANFPMIQTADNYVENYIACSGGINQIDDSNDEWDITCEQAGFQTGLHKYVFANQTFTGKNFRVDTKPNSGSAPSYTEAYMAMISTSDTSNKSMFYIFHHSDQQHDKACYRVDYSRTCSSPINIGNTWNYYYRIEKQGNNWVAKHSSDGSSWTTILSITITDDDWVNNTEWYLGFKTMSNEYSGSSLSMDWLSARKYISPEPSLSLGIENQITLGKQSYQLTTTIYNPSQIELTNITAIAVIGNNTYTQTTPYSISQGQYLTINTNASAGLIEKIRISALNCPVYIEALDVGRCE